MTDAEDWDAVIAHAGLVFDPRVRSLRVSLGAPIHFDFREQRLCLDRTPTVEPTLVPISDFTMPDGDTVEFRAGGKQYLIRSGPRLHRPLLHCLAALDADGCVLADETFDVAEIEISGGVMTSTALRRTTSGSERETLRIFREGDVVMRLVAVDAIRTQVSRVTAVDGRVTCVSEAGRYEFALRLPEPLMATVQQLIELGWT